MTLSIRNQLPGTVTGIAVGGAMASVRLSVEDGELVAVVTREAVDDLGLTVGSDAVALIKATEVSLATG
ncbi:molybdopterin-binding protein [Streptomyces sp. NPDC088254]|uniref:TOBE domain-containing protein n=1 Tax=Streptomyces sp. NPDC088254 TaxID=3365847 RepID=UPI0037F3B56C